MVLLRRERLGSQRGGAVAIENGAGIGHYSLSNFGDGYELIGKPSLSSSAVLGAFGYSPIGPFGPRGTSIHSRTISISSRRRGRHLWSARPPELSTSPNTLVISYDVDPIGPQGLAIRDASVYRPRFIDVTLH